SPDGDSKLPTGHRRYEYGWHRSEHGNGDGGRPGLTTGVESPTTGEAGGTDTIVTTVPADEVVETDTGLSTHNGAPRRRTRQAEPQTGTGITSRPQTRAAKRLPDDEERRRWSQVTAPSSEEHGPASITAATSGDGDEKHLTAIPTPAMPEEADVVRRQTRKATGSSGESTSSPSQ
ncbi:hypothetical protein PR001_g29016, partial [Phytophthora rubi]